MGKWDLARTVTGIAPSGVVIPVLTSHNDAAESTPTTIYAAIPYDIYRLRGILVNCHLEKAATTLTVAGRKFTTGAGATVTTIALNTSTAVALDPGRTYFFGTNTAWYYDNAGTAASRTTEDGWKLVFSSGNIFTTRATGVPAGLGANNIEVVPGFVLSTTGSTTSIAIVVDDLSNTFLP